MLLFLYHVHNVANTVNRYDSPTSICSAEKGNGDSPKDTRNWFASATRRIIVLITVALSILNFPKFNIMRHTPRIIFKTANDTGTRIEASKPNAHFNVLPRPAIDFEFSLDIRKASDAFLSASLAVSLIARMSSIFASIRPMRW